MDMSTHLDRSKYEINNPLCRDCGNHTRLPEGYGRFKIRGRGWQATHVALWLAGVIPAVPAEGVVDHLCRNTSCVNPAHLEVVSISENAKRGLPGITNVWQASKTHCPRGHALVAPNLVPSRLPGRQCLSCSRAWRGRPRKIDPAVADRVFKELTQ